MNSHLTPGGLVIYHHKWMFVDDDYNGFDIQESKRRSSLWRDAIDKYAEQNNIKKRTISSRIGKQNYWFELLNMVVINH